MSFCVLLLTLSSGMLFQVLIMKVLSHPNIVNLIEVIDDPTTDNFYMGKQFSSFLFPTLTPIPMLGVSCLFYCHDTLVQFLNMWKANGFVRVLDLQEA